MEALVAPERVGHYARELSPEERTKLEKDCCLVSDFKQKKLESDAQKNWDLFYKRNTTKFFKDRHWTVREFDELCGTSMVKDDERKSLLEVGCGVGNFIFPLIEDSLNIFIHACDFSSRAVNFVTSNPLYDSSKFNAFQCDATKDDLRKWIPANSVDIVSLIFVLSSIHPDKMAYVLANVSKVMKMGGIVLFRDYGLYDQAMLRFSPGHRLMNRFYVRQDGTRAFYFSEDDVNYLFTQAGFRICCSSYVRRETVNVKDNVRVPRIFIQGKFVKEREC